MPDLSSTAAMDPDPSTLYATYPGFTATSTAGHPDLDQTKSRRAQYIEETAWSSKPGNSPSAYGFSTSLLSIPGSPSHPHEIDIKFYSPKNVRADSQKPLLLLVLIHGGGFLQGTHVTEERWLLKPLATGLLDTHPFCAMSIHYRLAPEHVYPAQLEDCWQALRWIAEPAQLAKFNIDPSRVIVTGSSAGGALAAAVAQRAQREPLGLILKGVLMNVPVTCHPEYFPRDEYAWTLSEQFPRPMVPVWHCYLGGDAALGAEIGASPLLGDLKGLPPHFVAVDDDLFLRDEGRAYAAKLKASGVDVEEKVYDGGAHTFAEDHELELTARFWSDIRAWMTRMVQ